MGAEQINMAIGAEFTRRRTICGVEIRIPWSSSLNQEMTDGL